MKPYIKISSFSGCVFLLIAGTLFFFTSCSKENCKRQENGKIFVANEDDGTISVIDSKTYKEIETIDLAHKGEMYMAHNIQVAPNGETFWITAPPMHGHGAEFVIVANCRNGKILEYINLGEEQHLAHVVLDSESKFAYASANTSGQVIKIDAVKMEEVERYDLGADSGPHGLRYMNEKLYVACMSSGEMVSIDIATSTLTHIPVGGIAVQTAVLPLIGCVFVSVYDLKEVVRYDVSTGDTTVILLPAGSQGPIQLYPSPDNQFVYVCDQGIVNGNPSSNKLYVINTITNTVTNTVVVGNGAHGVVVSEDGTKIFVSNLEDNSISVVDAQNLTVITTIEVGQSPNGISTLDCD